MGKGPAIASLVLGVVGLLTGGLCGVGALAGIVLAFVALVRTSPRAPGGAGRELAWAGLVINVLAFFTLIPIAALVWRFAEVSGLSWQNPLPEPAHTWELDPADAPAPPPPPPPSPLAYPARGERAEGGGPRRNAATAPEAPAPMQAVRVGGTIREPKKLEHVSPVYPEIAKQARVQGIVILEATISPQGKVADVRVLRGIPLLDQAAIEAVKEWVYTPTLLNGVPVTVIMTITVNFTLQ